MEIKLISLVIPTFNEAKNIALLVKAIDKELKDYQYEIIVVDDHSIDGSFSVMTELSKKNKNFKFFLNPGEKSLEKSILFGIKKAKGDLIIGMDADFNHDPKVLKSLILEIEKGNDFVVASRFIKGGGMENKLRYYFTYLFNLILKIFFSFPIMDNTSGFYAIKTDFLNSFPIGSIYKNGYGEYHLRLVYLAKNLTTIKKVPVFYQERKFGKSKSKFLQMLFKYFKVAFELNFRYSALNK